MAIILSLVIGGIVLVVFGIKKYYERNKDYWTKRGVENIKRADGTISAMWALFTKKKNMLDFDIDGYTSCEDNPFGGTIDLGQPFLLIKDPDLIRQILVKDFDHFVDRRKVNFSNEPVFKNMLSLLEGQEWKNVRSVMSPTFTTGKIRRMFETFNTSGANLVEFIKTKPVGSPGSRDIVIKEFASRYLVDVIASAAFGMETSTLKDPNSIFYKMAKQTSDTNAFKMAKMILLVICPALSRLGLRFFDSESVDFFESTLRDVLKKRSADSKEKRDDFLQLLIETRKGELKNEEEAELEAFEKDAQLSKGIQKEKVNMNDDMILAQCLLFFLAGLDTTGAVLCFAYYLLALHPEIQEKLYDEVSASMKESGGKVDYEAVNQMEYMDKVISEILRMYPPGTRLERRCTRDYTIPGTKVTIEKDIVVYVPVIGMHRDPKIYPDPLKFDPERFTSEAKAARHPYTYLPFGQGPRNCIGMRFALMEAKVALAYSIYNFSIEPSATTPIPIKVDPNFGARPDTTVELRFKERQHN